MNKPIFNFDKPTLNFDKPIQTRSGNRARILCRDAGGIFPLIALVDIPLGDPRAVHYASDGRFDKFDGRRETDMDLINVPEIKRVFKSKFWFAVTPDGTVRGFMCEPHKTNFIAVREVEVEVMEGEGL